MIIGYAYVVGEILHAGHILHLRNCRDLCDKLIVGVLTDEAVMEKKPRPAIAFEERIRLVKELACVDAAVPQYTYVPVDNLTDIKPDILFECQEHEVKEYPFFEGRVVAMPYYPGVSSSKIKERIRGEIEEGVLFHQVKAGEIVEVNWRRQDLRFACCDCGLTHRLRFAIVGHKLRLRAYLDDEGTAYCRKRKTDE